MTLMEMIKNNKPAQALATGAAALMIGGPMMTSTAYAGDTNSTSYDVRPPPLPQGPDLTGTYVATVKAGIDIPKTEIDIDARADPTSAVSWTELEYTVSPRAEVTVQIPPPEGSPDGTLPTEETYNMGVAYVNTYVVASPKRTWNEDDLGDNRDDLCLNCGEGWEEKTYNVATPLVGDVSGKYRDVFNRMYAHGEWLALPEAQGGYGMTENEFLGNMMDTDGVTPLEDFVVYTMGSVGLIQIDPQTGEQIVTPAAFNGAGVKVNFAEIKIKGLGRDVPQKYSSLVTAWEAEPLVLTTSRPWPGIFRQQYDLDHTGQQSFAWHRYTIEGTDMSELSLCPPATPDCEAPELRERYEVSGVTVVSKNGGDTDIPGNARVVVAGQYTSTAVVPVEQGGKVVLRYVSAERPGIVTDELNGSKTTTVDGSDGTTSFTPTANDVGSMVDGDYGLTRILQVPEPVYGLDGTVNGWNYVDIADDDFAMRTSQPRRWWIPVAAGLVIGGLATYCALECGPGNDPGNGGGNPNNGGDDGDNSGGRWGDSGPSTN
jgi:hypothetical protein